MTKFEKDIMDAFRKEGTIEWEWKGLRDRTAWATRGDDYDHKLNLIYKAYEGLSSKEIEAFRRGMKTLTQLEKEMKAAFEYNEGCEWILPINILGRIKDYYRIYLGF